MATVEQCETQTSGLPSISKTLNLYDSFKPAQEEEKDSDEESFHLPMLDGDDDLENDSKETLTNGLGKELHNDETEDDILNKFETNGTPDIDPKMEDSILNEIDNILEKKLDENTIDTLCESKDSSTTDKKETHLEKKQQADSGSSILNEMEGTSAIQEENKENNTDCIKTDLEDKEILNTDVDMLVKEGENKSTIEENKDDKNETVDKSDEIVEEAADEIVKEAVDEKVKESADEIVKETCDEIMEETVDELISNDNEVATIKPSDKTEFDTAQKANVELSIETTDQEKNDLVESSKNSIELNNTNTDIEDSKLNNEMQSNISVEAMDTDNGEEKEVTNENIADVNIPNELSSKENNTICEDSNHSTTTITDNIDNDKESNCEVIEKECINDNKSEDIKENAAVVNNTEESDKCENSNDSSKSPNLECEDLLDISIIRDADEDNASAIEENARENANDAHPSEKSDNDNDEQEEESDKAEIELDESEMDQEDTLLANDKDDNMDFEDGSNSMCDQDNITSDSESKSNAEVRDSESESKDASTVLEQTSDINDIDLSCEKTMTEVENVESKSDAKNSGSEGTKDEPKENINQVTGSKRSFSETDDLESSNKKIKLSDQPKTDEKISTKKISKTKTLLSFEKFMQNKKLENKLSRSDLEQFCLQKISEAIMHKSDVGELHQTIKKQEQIIENLRKDLQQLTKQTRDLDIVNKKLMNELRTQNGPKKPLVPLKITRSVGLQVKLNAAVESNNRRKVPMPATPRTPTNNSITPRPRTIAPANNPVVRQVASPRKTPAAAPLLSQALQNRPVPSAAVAPKRPQVRPKTTEPQKSGNSSVIDLTDEDDKASKGVVGNPVKILNKTIPLTQGKTINLIPAKTVPNKTLNSNQNKTVAVGQVKSGAVGAKVGTPTRSVTTLPQGVRLTPTQVKNGSIAIPGNVVTSSSGTTQFMYVVQQGPVVNSTAGGTQKAVLLNFQPTSGVLTSTLNGSAVSVLPSKPSNTVQLKTVTAPRKHPAPLPNPPPITANASLKPLLPKPHLSIRKTDTGIILQWRMPYNLDIYEAIASYQLFAYQETNAAPSTDMWRKVGDVKALALPMACTLTQFADKNKYYFAVRSIDVHKRIGAFSDPEEISL